MSPDRPWRGLYTATALPFNDDLSVDYDSYAEHVALAGGVRHRRRLPQRVARGVPDPLRRGAGTRGSDGGRGRVPPGSD